LLMTAVQAFLILAALSCMWIGLSRIRMHGRFGAEASIVRCPHCNRTFEPPTEPHAQCPHCGLNISVKRIILTRRIGTLSASMP
jgi:DNA-directed RNA polymerase subunit RPC12/RpoP